MPASRRAAALFAALACATAAAPVLAQPQDASPQQALAHYQAERKPQLDQLHARLKLAPAQEPAWSAFVRDTARTAQDFAGPTGAMPRTTPERLDMMVTYMQGRLDAEKRRAGAVKAFYGKLTPAQRATFDGQDAQSARPLHAAG